MLIEFRCENHRSIRDEQALSMEAVLTEEVHAEVPRGVKGCKEKLLPAVALYGANASGKTNLILALLFLRNAVVYSQRTWALEGGIPVEPFAWGSNRSMDSVYIITFVIGETKYEYGLGVNESSVAEEWLDAWPHGKKQSWFHRVHRSFKFGQAFSGENKTIEKLTRINSLFLSTAAQNNHSQVLPVYSYINSIHSSGINTYKYAARTGKAIYTTTFLDRMISHDVYAEMLTTCPGSQDTANLLEILIGADVGIVDLRFVEDRNVGFLPVESIWRAEFLHTRPEQNGWLELEAESRGTITLYRLGLKVIEVLKQGSLLVIDELESSLHPILAARIIRLFNDPATNPNNAQLIFTTHDTQLLGNMFGEPVLRRDQVWFTEKDQEGATKLYPLTDYKPRKNENLERGYLQGRYGAIPFLGDFKFLSGDRS